MRFLAICMMAFAVVGCASAPVDDPEAMAEYERDNDPLEPTNRAIFDFNQVLDTAILKPVAEGYRFVLPAKARESVHNFLFNLSEPWTFVNDLLQGQFMRALNTFGRFTMNSTFGLFGLFDAASEVGWQPHKEDFGQTMAVWGVGEGPYLMLPVLGPSNPRDLVGRVVDFFADPFNLWVNASNQDWAGTSRLVLNVIDTRERLLTPLDDLKTTSLDFYISIRSMTRQIRESEVRNKELPDDQLPSLSSVPEVMQLNYDFTGNGSQ